VDMTRALTEKEVATRLAVSPFTVRAWRRQGRGPAFMKLGRAVRYRPEAVETWAHEATIATSLSSDLKQGS
jgi:excisionase family DNA binding protein